MVRLTHLRMATEPATIPADICHKNGVACFLWREIERASRLNVFVLRGGFACLLNFYQNNRWLATLLPAQDGPQFGQHCFIHTSRSLKLVIKVESSHCRCNFVLRPQIILTNPHHHTTLNPTKSHMLFITAFPVFRFPDHFGTLYCRPTQQRRRGCCRHSRRTPPCRRC